MAGLDGAGIGPFHYRDIRSRWGWCRGSAGALCGGDVGHMRPERERSAEAGGPWPAAGGCVVRYVSTTINVRCEARGDGDGNEMAVMI